jgi:RNA polymerase sigma-70 factor (ECF subfamily)
VIDRAGARRATKRNWGVEVSIDRLECPVLEPAEHFLALDSALERLLATNPRAAKVVELRYFGGLSHKEIAEVIGVDRRTVDRDWAFARVRLYSALS